MKGTNCKRNYANIYSSCLELPCLYLHRFEAFVQELCIYEYVHKEYISYTILYYISYMDTPVVGFSCRRTDLGSRKLPRIQFYFNAFSAVLYDNVHM